MELVLCDWCRSIGTEGMVLLDLYCVTGTMGLIRLDWCRGTDTTGHVLLR